MWHPKRQDKRDRARELRKHLTRAERDVWELVRNRRLLGLKFRRQHVLRGFVVDFYCAELKLVLEIDGGVHATPERAAYDAVRSAILEGAGFRVVRLPNERCAKADLVEVLRPLVDEPSPPTPLPLRERGQG